MRVYRRGGQERPALELVALRITVQRKEVIPEPDAVDAKRVGSAPCIAQLCDRALLGMDGDADLETSRFPLYGTMFVRHGQ